MTLAQTLWRRWMPGALAWLLASFCAAAELELSASRTPGLFDQAEPGGPLRGPAVDMIQHLLREAGVPGRITEKPLARGLLDAKTRPWTCIIGAARSPAVDADYVWFGPLARTRMVVLGRPDSTVTLRGADDLRARSMVVARGSLPDRWLNERQLAATRVADNTAAYRMLLRQHADFWVVNELLAHRLVREAGGAPLPVALVVQNLDNHLACHSGLPPDIQARLAQAVVTLRAQGALKAFGLE